MPLPDILPIVPFTRPVKGKVDLPGSKSITNRALLLAALCENQVTLDHALFSEDTKIMADALRQLGFAVREDASEKTIQVDGHSGTIPAEQAEIFVGNAGTAARFLTALCAAAPKGIFKLDGIAQMRKRPMKGLIDALRLLGAEIQCLEHEGFFPLVVHARGLGGGTVEIDASASSQFLSALLMVSPLALKTTTIRLREDQVRWPFVSMTINLMKRFGRPDVEPTADRGGIRVESSGAYHLPARRFTVESDATAASYFIVLPIVVGGEVTIKDYHFALPIQGDVEFAETLATHGLISGLRRAPAMPTHQIQRGASRKGLEANFEAFSDTFLTLAAISPLLEGRTKITGIAHTRKQETDRVSGMFKELKKLGQEVIETEDTLEIHPRPLRSGVEIETYGDHRFAMSFAILGCHDLNGDGQPWLSIRDPGCCAKTFPDFFEVLESLRRNSSSTG